MSTTVIRCPNCGAMLRAAVQPKSIVLIKNDTSRAGTEGSYLWVAFDNQNVAHECKD